MFVRTKKHENIVAPTLLSGILTEYSLGFLGLKGLFGVKYLSGGRLVGPCGIVELDIPRASEIQIKIRMDGISQKVQTLLKCQRRCMASRS
jgi:hypothetical protein